MKELQKYCKTIKVLQKILQFFSSIVKIIVKSIAKFRAAEFF